MPSQTGVGRYTVSGDECDCPDHETRGVRCKHSWAVEFFEQRATAPDGTVTETRAVRVTYGQRWPQYNAAQVSEGREVQRMLANLCHGIEQPVQHRGRPRLALADMTFAVTMKVFSGFSSRRFSSALADCADDGLIARQPHYNSVNAYMADPALTPVLKELIQVSALPMAAIETKFAVDATGFSTGRFERWYMKRYGQITDRREWVKFHAMIGVDTQIITACEVTDWQSHDSPQFIPLLNETSLDFDIQEVMADKGYLARNNVAMVEMMGATPYMPFKSNNRPQTGFNAWGRMFHRFAYEREEFLAHYHQRSNVESAFSAIKRKYGDSLRTRTFAANQNEALAKALCFNLSVVNRAMHEFGIEPNFR